MPSQWLIDQYRKTCLEVARWPQWMRDMLEREKQATIEASEAK